MSVETDSGSVKTNERVLGQLLSKEDLLQVSGAAGSTDIWADDTKSTPKTDAVGDSESSR
ncbi:hypothetical protein [Stenotrophomonas acidaminiphila]|uniref:hypothetical protein n=1 Tax=Stenotrophomonas acidaminiphila TaxID=128780 RepID=UPI0028ADC4A6|nr:hypothetical protein [Stenotrophomonas acidaminiphila]